jgi:hypothetical protein
VGVFENGANFVEMGWRVNEDVDQKTHPYRSWVNNGVPNSAYWNLIDVPRGTSSYVEFGVKDANDDNWWTFTYDNSDIGDQKLVTMAASASFALSESETNCSDDNLKARFTNLRAIHTQNGAFVTYHSLGLYINDSYQGQYDYANESIDTYHVCKPTACNFP